jgi:hypothetical protein
MMVLPPVDARLLQLLQRESLASTLLGIVANGLAVNNRAQQAIDRPWEHSLSLGKASFPPPVLTSRLVVPLLDASLVSGGVVPVLVEVVVGDLEAEVGHFAPTADQASCFSNRTEHYLL